MITMGLHYMGDMQLKLKVFASLWCMKHGRNEIC